ncbi:MAG: RagB/SusD family nutrient uptake outer membrane protein [Bacteroidota bacterium]
MKKYAILFILVGILSSCSDSFLDEEPRGQLTTDGFFQNADDLELGLIALYAKANEMYNAAQSGTALMGGDDVTTRAGSNKGPFREHDTFSATNANPWVYWHLPWAVISAANNLIINYDQAIDATEEEREFAAGQAYFLRALSYFYLVRVYNEIPLIITQELNLEIEKSDPVEIYAVIIDDLQKAEDLLPNLWSGLKENIAPTKGSAKALLAQVYLTMTGYPVLDASNYALAAQKAKEVIDNAGTWGYQLIPNFEDLWTAEQYNAEIVFGLFYDRTISPWTWSNGNMRAPCAEKPEEEGGWDDYFAEINFFNKFPAGPRKDATFQTVIRPDATTTLDWTEGAQKHPYYKKMQTMEGTNPDEPWVYVDWWSNRTNYIIRYANVLLVYAEAQAMASAPDGSAYDALNQVRHRAGLADMTPGLSQLAFRDSVVMERAWEFAGMEINQARWYDLVRLERVEEAAADRHSLELPIINFPDKDDYFAPIPGTETAINPNL